MYERDQSGFDRNDFRRLALCFERYALRSAWCCFPRDIYFHYPDFIGKVQELIPGVTKDEELLCMLVALGQSVEEIEKLFCLPAEQVYMFQ